MVGNGGAITSHADSERILNAPRNTLRVRYALDRAGLCVELEDAALSTTTYLAPKVALGLLDWLLGERHVLEAAASARTKRAARRKEGTKE